MGRTLWREDGSVIYSCCWASPAQFFSCLIPPGLMIIFHSLNFRLPQLWCPSLCIYFLLFTTIGHMPRRLTAKKSMDMTIFTDNIILFKIWGFHGRWLWRMVSSWMLRRVALVRTDVSEEPGASIRVARIGELGTTQAATRNRRTLRRITWYFFAAYVGR
jgi:hypothetical protein